MRILTVLGPNIEVAWPRMTHLVAKYQKTCEKFPENSFRPEDIFIHVHSRMGLAWLVFEDYSQPIAMVITRVREEENGNKFLEVMVAVGVNFESWINDILYCLTQYKQQMGLDEIRAVCRRGMERWLQKYGWAKEGPRMVWRP